MFTKTKIGKESCQEGDQRFRMSEDPAGSSWRYCQTRVWITCYLCQTNLNIRLRIDDNSLLQITAYSSSKRHFGPRVTYR